MQMKRLKYKSGFSFYSNFIIGLMLISLSAWAEEPDTAVIKEALKKYKNENAVYTMNKQQLFIEFENNNLVAHTDVFVQKLLLTEIATAPSLYGYEYLDYSYINSLNTMPAAVAYVPNGDGYKKVRCTKYGSYQPNDEGIFYDDYRGMVVMFSGLTKNTVTETKYRLDVTEANLIPSFFMQENIPCMNNIVEISAPTFVKMRFVLKGENTDKIVQTTEQKNNNVIYRFSLNNIQPYKHVKGTPSVRYSIPQVIPIIESYQLPGSMKVVKVLSDPEHLYKYYYKFIRNINLIEDTGINRLVATLTKGDVTQKEKAAHIYDWVQKNIHYVGFEDSLGGFYPRQAALVYKRKFGDCKDMASIIVAMCRKAGIKAYFTWVGTTHLPFVYEETPFPGVDNHMICTINVDGEWIFLDGTGANLPFGKTREDIQGKQALVGIDEHHSKILTVAVAKPEENLVVDSTNLRVLSGKSVVGTIKNYYHGVDAWRIAEWLNLINEKEKKDKFIRFITQEGNNKYEVTKYDVQTEKTGNREATITGEINIHDYLQHARQQYVVNLNVHDDFKNSWFETDGRTAPYVFGYKTKIINVVTLEIPKGSRVVYLPKSAKGGLRDLFTYKFSYHADGKKVTLIKEITLNTLSITQKDFKAYNRMINELQKQYKESVILSGK
jgi:Transglutaminase-like superfamily/Domain of Unknown Function with PDB structure (DUF3857)